MNFEQDPFGNLKIWEPPQAGRVYVVGVDVAEGRSDGAKGGDYSAAFVIDAHSMEHCATWHGQIDPWPFADEVCNLAKYYNTALLVIERNNHGLTVCKRAQEDLEYPNLYVQMYDADVKSGRGKPVRKIGIMTDTKTKPRIVDALREVVRRQVPIHDHRFYTEGLTWVLDDRGRPQTNEGANDDVLMAAGLAYYAAFEVFRQEIRNTHGAEKRYQEGAKRARRVQETWRKILQRTAEVQKGENPLDDVPEDLKAWM